MRRHVWVAFLCFLAAACSLPFHARAIPSPCEREAPAEQDEPIFADARALLTDSAAVTLRNEFDLHGSPGDVSWVGDPRTCRRLADALARASGKPPNYSQAMAAVRIGQFYMVRLGPGSELLIGPDFRVRTVFVGT